ncbi:hypothetical protein K7X08_005222 [Anisodus acutangulus]|uniref:Uncharacterized protein n=1 Tax=Anisodus acutangulus TaxID=402998 RepID=A0A9Q1MI29_9SOLA|nr:hypothetical protein K7X08_005222 [Anisodus acutangulus]
MVARTKEKKSLLAVEDGTQTQCVDVVMVESAKEMEKEVVVGMELAVVDEAPQLIYKGKAPMSHIEQLMPMIPVSNPKPTGIRIVEPTSPNPRLKGISKPVGFRVAFHINPNPILNEKQLPLVIINTSVQEVPSQTYDASSEHQETHSSTPGDRTIDQSAITPSLQSKKHDQSAVKKSGEGVTSENDLQLGLGDATQLQSHINQHGMHVAAPNSSVNLMDASTGRGGDMQVIAAHGEILQGIETEIQHVGEDEQEFEVQLDALPTVAVKQKQQESHKQLVLQKNTANQLGNSLFFESQNLEISASSQFQGLKQDDYEDRDEESIAQNYALVARSADISPRHLPKSSKRNKKYPIAPRAPYMRLAKKAPSSTKSNF